MAQEEANIDGIALDPVVKEAQERLELALSWESIARARFLDDIKFAEADSDNGYQWPNTLRQDRDVDQRPCLTINKTRQHNLQIINDAKQNKPGVRIRPVGNGATVDSANVLEAVVRHIEYISNAQHAAYDVATGFQVKGGIGWLRVITDYVDSESFDQDIFIKGVRDPLTVISDPAAQEPDLSDMNWAMIFEDHGKKAFISEHPKWKKYCDTPALGQHLGWIKEDTVRTAEYYRRVWKDDTLFGISGENGTTVILASKLPKELVDEYMNDNEVQKRKVRVPQIEYKYIIGYSVVEEKIWPGIFIPLIPVIGEQTVIEGILDRKGHTRALKDPQRIYNYWSSSAVEHVALQGKTPYIAAAAAIEGYESYWDTANTENYSVLPYNHLDDDGQELGAPARAQPPVMAQAYLTGMQVSNVDMMMVSGQYDSQMGAPGNERTGKAINERQRQGDNATYHFIDNLAMAIRHLGKILLDLIPKIYDTQRIVYIVAEDGTNVELQIDPTAQQAFATEQLDNQGAIKRILNPKKGKYEVQADVGPGYGTKRQEAFNALVQITTQSPQLVGVIGDLLLKASDFPLADEAAERLRRMVPPQALGQGPTEAEQALQAQVQQLGQLLDLMMDETAKAKLREMQSKGKIDVDQFRAETDRLKVLGDKNFGLNGAFDPAQMQNLINQAVQQALEDRLGPELPPTPGAQRAPDGNWYLEHPRMPGQFMKVERAKEPMQGELALNG